MLSVAGDYEYLELITNSKSGSFFFYSHDQRYIIKAMKVRIKPVRVTVCTVYRGIPHSISTLFLLSPKYPLSDADSVCSCSMYYSCLSPSGGNGPLGDKRWRHRGTKYSLMIGPFLCCYIPWPTNWIGCRGIGNLRGNPWQASEAKFFRKILEKYYNYHLSHPDSLLIQFCGMYMVKNRHKRIPFIVMKWWE